jgi:uncharacterized protein YabE (DUF348 family)
MESVLSWIKEKWAWILGAFGILVIALGTIFGKKKVGDDKTVSLHENKTSGLAAAKQIELNAKEAISIAEQKHEEKQAEIEKNKQIQIDNLKSMEQVDLTAAVANRFGFKNGDEQ